MATAFPQRSSPRPVARRALAGSEAARRSLVRRREADARTRPRSLAVIRRRVCVCVVEFHLLKPSGRSSRRWSSPADAGCGQRPSAIIPASGGSWDREDTLARFCTSTSLSCVWMYACVCKVLAFHLYLWTLGTSRNSKCLTFFCFLGTCDGDCKW